MKKPLSITFEQGTETVTDLNGLTRVTPLNGGVEAIIHSAPCAMFAKPIIFDETEQPLTKIATEELKAAIDKTQDKFRTAYSKKR